MMIKKSARQWAGAVVRQIPSGGYVIWSGPRTGRRVSLTFDDGPDPRFTPQIQSILRDSDVRATFFLVGQKIEEHPGLVAELIAEGHELGNHTYSHTDLSRAGWQRGVQELVVNDRLLRRVDTRFEGIFRPPWGRLGLAGMSYALRHHRPAVMWTLDSLDYHRDSSQRIIDRIQSSPLPGGTILLFHDDNDYTVEALPEAIRIIRERGLTFGTVSELAGAAGSRPEPAPVRL